MSDDSTASAPDLDALPVLDEPVLHEITSAAGMAPLELIEMFIEDSETNLGAMAEALAAGDRELLNRAAHSMKSSAGNVGAQRVAALSAALEKLTKHDVPSGSAELLARLQAAFGEFGTHVAAHRDALAV